MPAQSSTAGAQSPAAFEVRFGQIGLMQLQLHTTDPQGILEHLTERMTQAPRFFERMAVGLDVSALPQTPDTGEMRAVLSAVQQAGLVSVGLINSSPAVEALAGELSLPILGSLQGQPSSTAQEPTPLIQALPHVAAPPPPASAAAPPPMGPPPGPPTLPPSWPSYGKEPPLYQMRPVRSGQRIYAKNRDLVVLANVGSGAEVIADGCVHVYGTLRGRAVAGARGDRGARVFCTDFRAELISLAGTFRVFETFPAGIEGRPVHIWLVRDELRLARIGAPPSSYVSLPLSTSPGSTSPGDAR